MSNRNYTGFSIQNTNRFRPDHRRWLRVVGEENVRSVEHFRVPLKNQPGRFKHIAVVVMKDGRCGIGVARPDERDVYTTGNGYSTAVGKALRVIGRWQDRVNDPTDDVLYEANADFTNAVKRVLFNHWFVLDNELEPSVFYAQLRNVLVERGYLNKK